VKNDASKPFPVKDLSQLAVKPAAKVAGAEVCATRDANGQWSIVFDVALDKPLTPRDGNLLKRALEVAIGRHQQQERLRLRKQGQTQE
jgi:hypothetical protein